MNRKTMLVSVMMILALGAGVYGWTSANTANKNISQQKQELRTMASKNGSLETQLEALKLSNQAIVRQIKLTTLVKSRLRHYLNQTT